MFYGKGLGRLEARGLCRCLLQEVSFICSPASCRQWTGNMQQMPKARRILLQGSSGAALSCSTGPHSIACALTGFVGLPSSRH